MAAGSQSFRQHPLDEQRISSFARVLLLKVIDHGVGLIESIAARMDDPRRANRIRWTLVELLRERIYDMAKGLSSQDDVDRLAHDPAFRLAVWDRSGEQIFEEHLSSQPTQARLIDILAACHVRQPAGRQPRGGCEYTVKLGQYQIDT